MKLCIEQFGCWPGWLYGKPLRLGWKCLKLCVGFLHKKASKEKHFWIIWNKPLKSSRYPWYLLADGKEWPLPRPTDMHLKGLRVTGFLACALTHFAAPFWDPSESLDWFWNFSSIWISWFCFICLCFLSLSLDIQGHLLRRYLDPRNILKRQTSGGIWMILDV